VGWQAVRGSGAGGVAGATAGVALAPCL
jgi:hypothetical protein